MTSYVFAAASGWKAVLSGYAKTINVGHSLGASEVTTLKMWGAVGQVEADALPFGRIAPIGVDVRIGNRDPINGFWLGKILNPWAETIKVPWFGHPFRPNYSNEPLANQVTP